MRATLIALIVAAAASLAGCGLDEAVGDDSFAWGTVLSIQDADHAQEPEELAKHDDHPLVPDAGWEIVVQMDDGAAVTVTHNGTRRYAPGERVRLLVDEAGELLL